jgi:hypothetical protein
MVVLSGALGIFENMNHKLLGKEKHSDTIKSILDSETWVRVCSLLSLDICGCNLRWGSSLELRMPNS